MLNLVANAMEAIGEGGEGGKVTIETAFLYLDRPNIGSDGVKEGEYCMLTVQDNGPGIIDEDVGRIFEPFYTRKVMGRSGTGLGLSIVWNTVQDHNGVINVASSSSGTRFDLYFPVTAERVEDIIQRTPTAQLMGAGETILIIDDSPSQRDIAFRLLDNLGYVVTSVASGEQAVEDLKNRKVDLLLLDMIMDPGIDGRETYRQIVELHPGQRAVIASGYSQNQDVIRTQEMGAGPFVSKPYSLEQLGLAIRGELDRSE